MKLISCHIENFGKLNNFSFDFDGCANVICAENGWGKSSFAAFILAMFYGLDKNSKRSIEENDRLRFKPWQGGVFGGQLRFGIAGKEYVITRTFGVKASEDEFELRDAQTNMPSEDYSENIGEEIFRINKRSFMRSAFIGQGDSASWIVSGQGATDDINAKIGNLADDTGDLNSFNAATERLQNMMRTLASGKSAGSINKREADILALERKINSEAYLPETLEGRRKELAKLQAEAAALKEETTKTTALQKQVSEYRAAAGRKEEWDRLRREVTIRKADAAAGMGFFPKGIVPSVSDVNEQIRNSMELAQINERAKLCGLSESEKQELYAGNMIFSDGIPNGQELDDKLSQIEKLTDYRQRMSASEMTGEEKKRFEELSAEFAGETESAAVMAGKWNNRCNRKASYGSSSATLSALKMSASKAGGIGTGLLLLIIGAVLAAGGIAVFIMGLGDGSFTPGLAVMAVGGVMLIIGAVLRAGEKARADSLATEIEKLQRAINEDAEYIAGTDREIEEYLARHGRFFSEDIVGGMLQEILAENYELNTLKRKADRAGDPSERAGAEKMRAEISSFLAKYGLGGSEAGFTEDIYKLRGLRRNFIMLNDKNNDFREAKEKAGKKEAQIKDFLISLGFVPETDLQEQLNRIKDKADDYYDAAELLVRAQTALEDFEMSYEGSLLKNSAGDAQPADAADVTGSAPENGSMPSLDEIHEHMLKISGQLEETQDRIMECRQAIDELERETDEWEEDRIKLGELKDIQAGESEQLRLLSLTKDKLEAAKLRMTSKYSDPILSGFAKYYSMITGNGAEAFHVDADIRVTADEYGRQRPIAAYSSGYRDLIGVCLRMSLVDAMYRDEAPVIIMDDPFANLDDCKVEEARNFIDRVAEKYQVIYFTCSRARG